MNIGEKLVADKYIDLGYEVIKTGIPDFLILKDGELSFIEVKSGEQKLSKEQERTHEILSRNGFKVKIEMVQIIDKDNKMCIFHEEIPKFREISREKNIEDTFNTIIENRFYWTNIVDIENLSNRR